MVPKKEKEYALLDLFSHFVSKVVVRLLEKFPIRIETEKNIRHYHNYGEHDYNSESISMKTFGFRQGKTNEDTKRWLI